MSPAEWIGWCVIGALVSVATALPFVAAIWAIDKILSATAAMSSFTQWSLTYAPFRAAVQVNGWRFWRWCAFARKERERTDADQHPWGDFPEDIEQEDP